MENPETSQYQIKTASRIKRLALVVLWNCVILVVFFCSAELFYRWYIVANAEFEWECFEYDKALGWVPKPGNDDKMVFITPDRFRKTQPPGLPVDSSIILACGDSFTFGNHVLDNETWPYYLSEKLKCRVINAGVSGYGLDQIILRLERIISEIQPDLVIISLVYNDIQRCELSKRCQFKPYYEIVEGRLVLRNQPVPSPIKSLNPLRWFERSLIVRKLLLKQTERWQEKVHTEGLSVAGKLCEYAKELVSENGSRLIIVFQPNMVGPSRREAQDLKILEDVIRQLDIPLLNLIPVMQAEFEGRKKARKSLFVSDGHMISAGNRWIAEKIALFISVDKKE